MAELIKNIIGIFQRRLLLIFGIFFLGFLLTAVYIHNATPLYTAKTQIVFNKKDIAYIKTQQALLESSQILLPIIETFGLRHSLHLSDNPAYIKDPQNPDQQYGVIKTFKSRFKTEIIPGSYILNLYYTDKNPHLASKIINKLTEKYIADLPAHDFDNQDQNGDKRLEYLQRNVENALQQLENFKNVKNFQLNSRPLLNLNTQTTTLHDKARLEYAEAKAALAPFKHKSGATIMNDRAPALLNNRTIQKLKFKKRDIEDELKELSQRYGPKHPRIIALTNEFKKTHDAIEQEKTATLAHVQSNFNNAKAKVEALENKEDIVLSSSDTRKKDAERRLETLKKNAEDAIQKYKDYEQAQAQNMRNKALDNKIAKILEKAHVPLLPSYPKKIKILAWGTALSLIFALLIALITDKSRKVFLSGRQLEAFLNIPCFALIPKAEKLKEAPLGDYVTLNPSSQVAEAVRALRLTLRLREDASSDISNKVITVTSSFPNEGKTTLCAWLGRLAAKSGERVILIDGDLRRPSLHRVFDQKNTLSLVEYLSGQNKLEEVINTSDPSGLHIIYGRNAPNSALDVLSSDKMDDLMRSLRKTYDLIIIDSPASMAVADAKALNKFSDQLLYVVHWNKTPREIVHNGIMQFMTFKKPRVATVLTNINLKKHVQFGYGGAENYIGDYKSYDPV